MITPHHYEGKPIAIFGLGLDGTSAVKALCRARAIVYVWDDNQKSRLPLETIPEMREAKAAGRLKIIPPEEMPWDRIQKLILSPGVPFTHPAPASIVQLAQKHKVPVICTVEVLYETVGKNHQFVCITGTNGKSTTTALTGHIIKRCDIPCEVGGNIGVPVLDLNELPAGGVYVLELSSYQLDLLDSFKSDVSILLNITPDHIDRHGSMEGYIKAKKRIFRNQDKSSAAVITLDNDNSRKVYEGLLSEGKIGNVIPISTNEAISKGVAVIDGHCTIDLPNVKENLNLGVIKTLAGQHNAENIAAAVAASVLVGCQPSIVQQAVQSFPGLRHRLQYLGEIGNVTYVNDSKATNAEATEKALSAYRNIHWILGGKAKEGGIDSIAHLFSRVKHAYLIGEAQGVFAETLERKKIPYILCGTLQNAFEVASQAAAKDHNKQPVVLLSPACASFDQWKNFEERGDFFCDLVENLRNAKQRGGAV